MSGSLQFQKRPREGFGAVEPSQGFIVDRISDSTHTALTMKSKIIKNRLTITVNRFLDFDPRSLRNDVVYLPPWVFLPGFLSK